MIGVLGSGYWGKNLVRVFHELGVLTAICDKNDATLATFRQMYPEARATMAVSDLLAVDAVKAVVIATPAETHFTLAREALLAGKHVYVEKPLVLNEEDGEELIRIADKAGLVLMVGHLLQYHPAFIRLKELVASGELGRVNYIHSQRLNLGKVRREENILWSFAPHDISMILSLALAEPESVMATGGNFLHSKIADVTVSHLEFPSGLKGHIFVSWLHPFKVQNLVVVGEKQMAVFDDTNPWEDKLLLYPHEIKWQGTVPMVSKANAIRVEVERAEPLRRECERFLQCIESGERPLTDGQEGLRVLRVLNACQRSLDQGGRRISLSPSKARDEAPAFYCHETAIVEKNAAVGAGTRIWHFSHVLPGSVVGENCNIGQNVVVGPDVKIGSGCKIQNNVSVYKGVALEDNVFCGPSMVFTNVRNPRAHIPRMDELQPTTVGHGASLGANCTIVCGNRVGRFAFIGAGAVVTKDVPDHALMAGNPARRMGWVCECGEKLGKELSCARCGGRYAEVETGLARMIEPV